MKSLSSMSIVLMILAGCLLWSGCASVLPQADSAAKVKASVWGVDDFIDINAEQGDNIRRDDYGNSRQYSGRSVNVVEQVDAVEWTKAIYAGIGGLTIFGISLIVMLYKVLVITKKFQHEVAKWLANNRLDVP